MCGASFKPQQVGGLYYRATNRVTGQQLTICSQLCATQLIGPKLEERSEFDELRERLANGNRDVEVRTSTLPDAGLGLFARRAFAAGEPITRYDGFIIPYEQARKASRAERSHHHELLPMRFTLDGSRDADTGLPIVDPSSELVGRGMGAWAKEARDPARANAEYDFLDNEANMRVIESGVSLRLLSPHDRFWFLRATRDIAEGDEILH